MIFRRVLISTAAAMAVLASFAIANSKTVEDTIGETAALKQKPQLDITKAKADHAKDGRLLHTVTMNAKVSPAKTRERPLILINTKGSKTSSPEFVILGKRVLKIKRNKSVKVGAADIGNSKRTWKYRFKPESIGSPGKYGWAALTSKGKTSDLAPNQKYASHRLPAPE